MQLLTKRKMENITKGMCPVLRLYVKTLLFYFGLLKDSFCKPLALQRKIWAKYGRYSHCSGKEEELLCTALWSFHIGHLAKGPPFHSHSMDRYMGHCRGKHIWEIVWCFIKGYLDVYDSQSNINCFCWSIYFHPMAFLKTLDRLDILQNENW